MTIATTRYGHMAAPWDAPLSMGVQAFIEYNGYVLNDRHQSDRIRVTNITGLDDADVADAREAIPGDHGEVAYDALYRGRTFVMSGRIEAGSLGVLKRLERDLKAAFASLVEAPMKFRWFDVTDTFDDPQTLQNYSLMQNPVDAAAVAALPGLVVANGVLHWGTTVNVALLRTADNRLWSDKQVSLRLVVGSIDASDAYVVLAYKDSQNHLTARLQGSNLVVVITAAGVPYTLATTAVTGLQQGGSVWLRGRTEGDLVTAELWHSPPRENALPDLVAPAWLQGQDADLLGDQVLSLVGFGAHMASANWALDSFKVESLCPGDVSFNVRKMPNGMSIKDSQDSLSHFNRAFQITARASKSFASCSTQSRSQPFTPSPLISPTLGFRFPLTFPLRFRTYISGPTVPANTFVTVQNRGNVWTRPVIVVYGSIFNFTIINLQNGQQITLNSIIADGDFAVFDCAARTLVNSNGFNLLSAFSSTSRVWMQLEPGPNDIYLAGLGYGVNTKMIVYWRHAST